MVLGQRANRWDFYAYVVAATQTLLAVGVSLPRGAFGTQADYGESRYSMTKLIELILEAEPELFRQPNAYTCGPSAVYMLSRMLGKLNSFEEIKKMTHANPITGALPTFVASALRRLGLQAKRTSVRSSAAVSALAAQGPTVLLGVLDGWPHWVLVYRVQNEQFQVADPSAGMVSLSAPDMTNFLDPKRLNPLFRLVGGLLGTAFQVQC